jgi:CRP/FNR family transcriptional regulator, cyclic AMP receptor protein
VATRQEHHGAFGQDAFGRRAERAARFFGTPQYILGQSLVVIAWIALNAVAIGYQWDPYPFILLNLFLSMLAALQAPVIMMSQNRQDMKDRLRGELDYEVNRRAESEIRELAQKVNRLNDRIGDIDELLQRPV